MLIYRYLIFYFLYFQRLKFKWYKCWQKAASYNLDMHLYALSSLLVVMHQHFDANFNPEHHVAHAKLIKVRYYCVYDCEDLKNQGFWIS